MNTCRNLLDFLRDLWIELVETGRQIQRECAQLKKEKENIKIELKFEEDQLKRTEEATNSSTRECHSLGESFENIQWKSSIVK